MQNRFFRRLAALAALALPLGATACDSDPNEPAIAERLVLTVNSEEQSLSLIPVDGGSDVQVRTIGLGGQATPTGVSARGAYAVVPLGIYPFAAVVDLRTGTVDHRVALPANSGATGSDFVNDSIAVVANPGRNSVTPINVLRGTAGPDVTVGTYPATVISDGGRVYVLNGNLVNFAPAGPGSVTVMDEQLRILRTVQLTGINPSAGAIIGNRLYVLNSGRFGGNNGSISVVNLQTMAEESFHSGFGEFPSSIAASPGGDLYVGIYGTGIVVWDPQSRTFRVPLSAPIKPAGSGIVSGLGFGYAGRLHTASAGNCQTPGVVHRLNASDGALERTVTVGICPFGIAFADVPEADDED
ncbi:hypothetical protein [Longimicrobium sp.]|uniref:hypothetical protein n=1 Tax=Longimicrobium sp. TaxID=2029185 RepID=UPI003B3BD2CB